MNNPSLRIFSRLAICLVALGLLVTLIYSTSNFVRHQHYWSDVVSPIMSHFAKHQHLLDRVDVNSLSVVSDEQHSVSDLTRARLELGQVVLTDQDDLFKVYARLNDDLLLELESDQSGSSIYKLYISLFKQQLFSSSVEQATALAQSWGLQLYQVVDSPSLKSQAALDSLSDQGYYLTISSDSVSALLRSSDGTIYRLQFWTPFSLVSIPVVVLLISGVLSALYALVAIFVQGYERKLRAVETVAERIARGELDARVKNVSEGSEAIERLSSAFNVMADHIQRLMLVQKEMIHAVSHELRTPVARIRFGVQMIEDCPNQEALRKQAQEIDGDIQELDELIDEILTYARLEQGGPILSFHQANLLDIVHQVVDEQSVGRPNLDIQAVIQRDSDDWAETEIEPRYIHRSIQNLVGNATRYASGVVKVNVSCDSETCRVDVEDDGLGIPQEDWESVFTPFARLDDSRTRASGGYGLGLSIVRRILYWHGGQAFLGKSEELGGAKFSLVWPRQQGASALD